jgi:DinB superfamily
VSNDALGVLLDQLDGAWELLDARLMGRRPWSDDAPNPDAFLTDEELFWEPVPGCWSLRPRGNAAGPQPVGKGGWLLDEAEHTPQPPPFTTIAWRMCHICVSPLLRYDYTFGSRSLTLDDVDWPGTAPDAVAFLGETHRRWRAALTTLDPDDALTVGLSQFPGGLDASVRFIDLLAWTNTEFTHHAAEIACLRDLYRARP